MKVKSYVIISGCTRSGCTRGKPVAVCTGLLARLLAIAGLVAAYMPASVAQSTRLLEEVVVTAQKREQNANDVGIAIAAFRGDDLEKLGFTDTRDLANLVPGLTAAKSSSGTPIYTLRGVGFNTLNLSSTSPVGIYFDEVSYAYPAMTTGLTFDVERVEVLKGPQGTLYGRNTTGGLINYIPNRPSQAFEASIKAEVGNFDSFGLEGFVNGGLTDTLSGRMAYKTSQSNEGWQESVSRDETLGEVDRSAVKLSLAWQPNTRFSVLAGVNGWKDQSDTQAGQAINFNPEVLTPANVAQAQALFGGLFPAGTPAEQIAEAVYVQPGLRDSILSHPDAEDADWAAASTIQPGVWPGTTFSPRPERFNVDAEMVSASLRLEWDFNDSFTFTSLTGYADLDRNDLHDRDGTRFELVVFNDVGSIESFSQEFRISGRAGDFQIVAGLFYSSDETEDISNPWAGQTSILNRLRILVPAGAQAAGVTDPAVLAEIAGGFRNWQNVAEIETDTKAIFGQLEWDVSDTVAVTLGARYTEDDADFQGCSRDNNGDGNIQALWNAAFSVNVAAGECITFNETFTAPVDGLVASSLNENNVSSRLAVDWAVTQGSLLYASFSRGYKSGAFPQLSANIETQFEPAKQEKLDAFEIGIKSRLSDTAQLNASVYLYDYEDKQVFGEVLDPVFNTLTRLINVPKSEVKGVEADLTWSPLDRLTTVVSLSYLDTEIEKFVGFNRFAEPTDFAGAEFEYSPEWQGHVVAAYNYLSTSSLQGIVTIDISYSADQQADFEGDPAFAIDSYSVVGFNISLSAPDVGWDANVWVKNLTDKYYWNSVQTQTDTSFRYAALPRTFGASVRYNF